MFYWVDLLKPCWNCGKELKNWQTKDPVSDLKIGTNDPNLEVFYAHCENCDTWNQYKKAEPSEIVITVNKEAVFVRDIEGEKYYNEWIADAKTKEKGHRS